MDKEQKSIISHETLVPIGMIATMCAAAISFGVMYQKVEFYGLQITELKGQVATLSDKIDRFLLSNKSVSSR